MFIYPTCALDAFSLLLKGFFSSLQWNLEDLRKFLRAQAGKRHLPAEVQDKRSLQLLLHTWNQYIEFSLPWMHS